MDYIIISPSSSLLLLSLTLSLLVIPLSPLTLPSHIIYSIYLENKRNNNILLSLIRRIACCPPKCTAFISWPEVVYRQTGKTFLLILFTTPNLKLCQTFGFTPILGIYISLQLAFHFIFILYTLLHTSWYHLYINAAYDVNYISFY